MNNADGAALRITNQVKKMKLIHNNNLKKDFFSVIIAQMVVGKRIVNYMYLS